MRSPTPALPATSDSFVISVLIGAVISAAISWGLLRDVWSTGVFFDTDDATRMVQVRDWMAGQAWYDLHMHRLGLPGASPMHWTRIVDAPVALLVKIAGLFLDPVQAERAARIVFPFLLSVGVLLVGALIVIELISESDVMTACLLIALAGLSTLQFQPGRIDHHAPQILLLLTSCLFLLRAIDGRHARRDGFLSAGCLAASLAVSLENLPAACVIAACFAGLWAAQGKARAAALNGFSGGSVAFTPALYMSTMEPSRWFSVSCDAQSLLHVTAAMAGGAACLGLTAVRPGIATARARWLGLVAVAFGLALLLRTGFPQCGLDPYADVDPLVRSDWLDKVREAFGLSRAWREGLRQFVLVSFVPAVIGLVGVAIAIARTRDQARLRWIVWMAVSLATFTVAGYRTGYVQTAQATCCMGAAFLLSLLPLKWRVLRIPGAFALSTVAFTLIIPADGAPTADAPKSAQCARPQDAEGLTLLPAGLMLAPIDEGAYLLAFTQHQIVAAPYHRNNAGNRLEAEAFSLPADEALALLASHHVDYVAVCDERRNAPLVKALVAGAAGTHKLEAAGAYQVWRLEH